VRGPRARGGQHRLQASPEGYRMLQAIGELPADEREFFGLVRF
jgi:hypothetical protein